MSSVPSKTVAFLIPKHRWLQYSLRTLFVVVTVFCIWVAIIANRARDQKQAVEAILALGGTVRYEHQMDKSDPPGTEWLRKLIGNEFFFHVGSVRINGPGSLAYNESLTDTNLAYLKGFTDLQMLRFSSNNITDAGLVYLNRLTNLRTLRINSHKVSDASLVYLKDLTNLHTLGFFGGQFTGDGLVHLKGLPNLTTLDIRGTVTDDQLVHLKGMTQLESLSLYDTNITDAGLVHLTGLINLDLLYFSNTQVTEEGLKTLQPALPNCTFSYTGEKGVVKSLPPETSSPTTQQ